MKELHTPEMITLLGPTAVGKTRLAAKLAASINGQIISADSRQVYRRMDLGTGKDLNDYIVNGKAIPSHLIDIVEPGYEYSLFEFVNDFKLSYKKICNDGCIPILCGGTGLYIDAVLRNYQLSEAKPEAGLREQLESKSTEELIGMLSGLRNLHNHTDTEDRRRLIKALEISITDKKLSPDTSATSFKSLVFGLRFNRSTIRERITARLKQRLDMGMADEVSNLINSGISLQQLMFYGLEYKYLTLYVTGKTTFDEMFTKLNTGIHQFAKRQMTWFRRMERNGVIINWLEGEDGDEINLKQMVDMSLKAGIQKLTSN
jgi:tRNA dimethylallyltransferase